MPAVAAVTLILVGAAVLVIAFYLIYIALILSHVVSRLNSILRGVASSGEQAAPVGAVASSINANLEAGARALNAALPPDLPDTNGHQITGVGAGT